MEDPKDIYSFPVYAIRHEVRRVGHYELSCAWNTTDATQVRMIGQESDRHLDPQYDAICGRRIVLGDVVGFFLEIAQGPLQPSNLHGGANDRKTALLRWWRRTHRGRPP